jgi:ABC-2 type transport system permease protein
MSALLQAELMKLRTTRTFVALAGAALGLSLLVVGLTALLTTSLTERDVRELFTADFTGLFILLLGVVGMAGEWRHRTITSTILAAPDRLRLLAAKTLSYALAGALMSFIVTAAIMLVGTLILSIRGQPTIGIDQLADVLWRNLLVAALFGALGVCVGALVRNQTVAVVGVLIFAFVLEPAIVALASDVGRFGPTVGAPNGILQVDPFNADDSTNMLAPAVATLVLLGWVALAFSAAATLLRQRDLV